MTLTRTFDAPVEQVWKQWSESENVMRWWGPKGFTSSLAKIDFREGGVSLVCMRAPKEFGGFDMYNTWSYKKIVPHERIEFVLNFSDKDGNKLDPAKMGLPPGIPQDVPHVITFKSLGDKKVVPTVLNELMADKDQEKADRVMQAMLQMDKIDIEPLQRAYEGNKPRIRRI